MLCTWETLSDLQRSCAKVREWSESQRFIPTKNVGACFRCGTSLKRWTEHLPGSTINPLRALQKTKPGNYWDVEWSWTMCCGDWKWCFQKYLLHIPSIILCWFNQRATLLPSAGSQPSSNALGCCLWCSLPPIKVKNKPQLIPLTEKSVQHVMGLISTLRMFFMP